MKESEACLSGKSRGLDGDSSRTSNESYCSSGTDGPPSNAALVEGADR